MPRIRPIPDRFWEKVDRRGPDECWEWQAQRTNGYGRFSITRRDYMLAHRMAWTLTVGPIPDGMWVLHHCDNPPCVNPAHLFLGTPSDNHQDMIAKGRARRYDRHGERHPQHKLSKDQVAEIRLRYHAPPTRDWSRRGLTTDRPTYDSLGAEYGVSRSTIYNIIRNRTWT